MKTEKASPENLENVQFFYTVLDTYNASQAKSAYYGVCYGKIYINLRM
jgi:hypothetical protein